MPLNPSQLPAYIYGLHDIGGQNLMLDAQRQGWLLDSVDLRSQVSTDYSSLAKAGFGILVRLNHGYEPAGTIPPSNEYDAFADRCASYVAQSPGAHIWIIGNEMNLARERPELPGGTREPITPDLYAQCFGKCRAAIKSLAGHADDWVIPGAISPYNADTVYPGNVRGDWVQYMVDLLDLLQNQADGIALHCYTRDYGPDQVTSEQLLPPPFNDRHSQFRAFRDFLEALPDAFRTLPVFITETNPASGWRDSNLAWVQTAYQEVNSWNADPGHQPVQALILFRWQTLSDHPEWGIQDKPALIGDLRSSLASGYRVRWLDLATQPAPKRTPPPDFRVQWLSTVNVPNRTMAANSVLTGRVGVKNIGARVWDAGGANPLRLGYRWFNTQGKQVSQSLPPAFSPIPKDIRPGESVTFDKVELRAPQYAGTFTLKWDLVFSDGIWLSSRQSPTYDVRIKVTPAPARSVPPPVAGVPSPPLPAPLTMDPWAALFLGHDTPVSMVAGQTAQVNLRLKNVGASPWPQGGTNPIHVGYRWFDEAGKIQSEAEDRRTALPSDIEPDQEAVLGAVLAAPKAAGRYHLRWDLVAEGITWFADSGNPPLVLPVCVTALPGDIDSWRVESNLNPQEVAFSLDGNTATFWDSRAPQAAGQWFRLNFSAPRLVDGIQFLSPGKGFPSAYLLRISADGKEWIEAARVDSENAYDLMAVFAPQLVQYAQIDLLTPSQSESSWMISEILIHPATAWSASASHNGEAADRAVDNLPDSAWTSGRPQEPGMWFQLNLGHEAEVSGLTLTGPAEEAPASFRVSLWDSKASQWQVVYKKQQNTEPVDIVFEPHATQFVNVQLLDAGPRPWTIQRARVVREMDEWLGPSKR